MKDLELEKAPQPLRLASVSSWWEGEKEDKEEGREVSQNSHHLMSSIAEKESEIGASQSSAKG